MMQKLTQSNVGPPPMMNAMKYVKPFSRKTNLLTSFQGTP